MPERPAADGSPLPGWDQPITEAEGASTCYCNVQTLPSGEPGSGKPSSAGYVEFWTDRPCETYGQAVAAKAFHRTTDPAEITYSDDDQIETERWYDHGKLHREDGPAEIIYGDDGERDEIYWLKDFIRTVAEWERETNRQV